MFNRRWMVLVLCITALALFATGFVAVPAATPTPEATAKPDSMAVNPTAVAATKENLPTPSPAPTKAPEKLFKLTILHTNDIHANHAPDATTGDGGAALAASVIKQVRAANPNTLLLNAGDNFTGSLLYYQHRGQDSVALMKAMKYDAMTLGNHEFDDGEANLAGFISDLNFPVVSSNIDFSGVAILKDKTKPYAVVEKGGEKIGIIGLLTPDTVEMVKVGSITAKFTPDMIASAQENIDKLTKEGINKIILLSHIGYQADQEIAKKLKGVDVIVGGHSHTVLSNAYKAAEGPYPTVAESAAKEPVLIVQTGWKEAYLGQLNVTFGEDGVLKAGTWSGDVVFLSHFITPDPATAKTVADLELGVKKLKETVVGEAAVDLIGDRKVCRIQECNMGNLVTDIMIKESGAEIALMNSGGIRADIKAGKVTMGDVITVYPFGNLVSTFELKGEDLLVALETSVSKVENVDGRFLQVSGIKFKFDVSKEAGKRVSDVEVKDKDGKYQPLDVTKLYKIASNEFTRGGGDGFTVFRDKSVNVYDYGRPLEVVVAEYFKANSPVKVEVEGRITAVK